MKENKIYIIKYFESIQWGDDMGVDVMCFETYDAACAHAERNGRVKDGDWLYGVQGLELVRAKP